MITTYPTSTPSRTQCEIDHESVIPRDIIPVVVAQDADLSLVEVPL
jgi:hypothetical protein